jgi:hypothetical protein
MNVGCRMAGQFTDASETGPAERPGRHESTRHAAVYEFVDDGARPEAATVADLVEGETAWAAIGDLCCDAQGLLWFPKQAAVRTGHDEHHPVRVTRRANALYVEAVTLGGGPAAGQNMPPAPADRLPVVLE